MPNGHRNYLTVIILLSITLLGLLYLGQSRGSASSEIGLQDIPYTIEEWRGRDLSVSERTYAILETENLLMREYTNPRGEQVWLAVVYCAGNRSAFHPPEICYLGGGTELLDKGVEKIEIRDSAHFLTMRVNKLLMEERAGKQIAWYWFTAGDRVITNYYRQQCYILWDELRRNRSGGTLVRVSTRVIDDDLEGAMMRGRDFISGVVPILLDYLSPD